MMISRRFALLAFLTGLTGCSPLTALNTFGGKDGGSRRAIADIAYGPDPRQRLDVYIPEDKRTERPVAIFYYGGSWNSGSKNDYAFVGRALASRGFVTMVCDYRLVPYVRFPAFVEDCASVVRWTRDHVATFGGSPEKINVIGHSAGAYNALMIALDGRFLLNEGLEASVLKSVVGLSGPYDFLPLRVDVAKAAFAGVSRLEETQPISFAGSAAPPILLATGDHDTTVEGGNTYRLAEALRKRHARVLVRTYAGLSHVDTVLALSTTFRSTAPVLDDSVLFMSSGARRLKRT